MCTVCNENGVSNLMLAHCLSVDIHLDKQYGDEMSNIIPYHEAGHRLQHHA